MAESRNGMACHSFWVCYFTKEFSHQKHWHMMTILVCPTTYPRRPCLNLDWSCRAELSPGTQEDTLLWGTVLLPGAGQVSAPSSLKPNLGAGVMQTGRNRDRGIRRLKSRARRRSPRGVSRARHHRSELERSRYAAFSKGTFEPCAAFEMGIWARRREGGQSATPRLYLRSGSVTPAGFGSGSARTSPERGETRLLRRAATQQPCLAQGELRYLGRCAASSLPPGLRALRSPARREAESLCPCSSPRRPGRRCGDRAVPPRGRTAPSRGCCRAAALPLPPPPAPLCPSHQPSPSWQTPDPRWGKGGPAGAPFPSPPT